MYVYTQMTQKFKYTISTKLHKRSINAVRSQLSQVGNGSEGYDIFCDDDT